MFELPPLRLHQESDADLERAIAAIARLTEITSRRGMRTA